MTATEKSKKKGSHKDSTETGVGNSFGTYPKVVFLIILTELCERFSFYGLRTVLYIFFTEFLHLSPDTGTALYHTFTMICYFSPILGAIIADGYIGLYKTILSLSIVYLIGEAIVTLTSMRPLGAPNLIGPAIGLFIIGIGTGGIKPCVSAFGGSQFEASQTRFINTFFSVFYMSINIGSTVGTILTPILRSDVKCFGNDCYPLAFGVPAAFMFIAICSFIAGTFFYKRRGLQGNGNNVIIETVKCIFRALKNKIFLRGVKKQSWLQYADTHHSQQVISDVSAFLRVMLMFIPVPVFWALYDQQGSRWTDQAIQLDGRLGSFVVKPDQMQAVNPILIIILIPLFDFVVYPLFAKINFFKRLLQRMGVGMIFAVLSFLISALLEYKMQQALAANNPTNNIRALNLLPCNVEIFDQSGQERLIQISQAAYLNNKPVDLPKNLLSSMNTTQVQVSYSACSNGLTTPNLDSLDLAGDGPKTIVFYLENNQTKNMIVPYDNQNQKTGSSQVRFMSLNTDDFGVLTPQLSETGLTKDFQLASLSTSMSNSSYESMDYDFYEMRVKSSNSSDYLVKTKFYLASGGRYTVLLYKNEDNGQLDYVLLTDLYPNGVHLAWQLFQIFVMAIGEILFSISGIAFAFSQAPATMKSACQALWYIAVAIGNLIVVIVAESRFIQNQVFEYLFFAGVMAVATVVFVILALFYKYNDTQSKSDTDSNITETEPVINKEGNGYINSALDNYYDDNVEMHF